METENNYGNILNLPPEMLEMILSHLDKGSLRKAGKVCWKFYEWFCTIERGILTLNDNHKVRKEFKMSQKFH